MQATNNDWIDFWEGSELETPIDRQDYYMSQLTETTLSQYEIERLIALVQDNNQYEDDPDDVSFWNNVITKLNTFLSY